MKCCTKCKKEKPENEFYPGRAGATKSECKKCSNRRVAEARKRQRALGINRAFYILHDARRSDKKRGLENDLTKKFIETVIQAECNYCGDTVLQKTLDRIDNSRGHTQDNVVVACIRCNYLRKDMPYEAWLILVPSLREIVRKGLFGTWVGSVHN